MTTSKFPAKYSQVLFPILARALLGYRRILDPFSGVGTIRLIRPDAEMLEIEPEWAAEKGATVGDALDLPWADGEFDAVCTSPTYGNRMADHFKATDGSKRNTYRHAIGRDLHPNNSGRLNWGRQYRMFHVQAWKEVWRVLRPGGRFILNISDHIRKGKVIPVTRFHHLLLVRMGFVLVTKYAIETPRNRHGQNGNLRVEHEWVLVYHKPIKE